MTRTRPPRERGFALLVIFLIAAAVAFTMYQEMPRAAFESARDKEQLLMDRGNQYKRAIQVFYAVNKRYPTEIKDLENTNNKRFLRRRYIDPMTGQDEWRLIHTNGSFLTDSLVEKPPAQNASNGGPGAGQTPGGGPLGANSMNTAPAATNVPAATDPAANVAVAQNPAALRRPSDRGFSTGPGFPQQSRAGASPFATYPPGVNPAGAFPSNFDPDDPRTWPPITLTPPTQPGQPQPRPGQPQQGFGQLQQGFGQPQPNAQITPALQPAPQSGYFPQGGTTQPGTITQPLPPGQPLQFQPQIVQPQADQPQSGIPGQFPGQGGANPQPTALIGSQSDNPNQPQFVPNPDGQTSPQATNNATRQANLTAAGFNPQNPAAIGQANPAPPGNNSGNAALNAIDAALFRPNQAPASAGPTGSPGIAGVASKFEGASIKAYRERTKYQEWEFVFEPAANPPPGQPGAPPQNPQQNLNGPGFNGPGLNGLGSNGLGQNAPGQGSGMVPAGGTSNPFSMPNPFSPQPAAQ